MQAKEHERLDLLKDAPPGRIKEKNQPVSIEVRTLFSVATQSHQYLVPSVLPANKHVHSRTRKPCTHARTHARTHTQCDSISSGVGGFRQDGGRYSTCE